MSSVTPIVAYQGVTYQRSAESEAAGKPVRAWEPVAIWAVTLVFLALLAPRVMTYLDPVTGDEPFYLMTAMSVWQDHDINE